MLLLLLLDLLAQMVQLMAGAIDLAPRVFTLAAIHSGAGNPPAGPVHDRCHHLQLAQ
jgi:hypothetical protein